MTIEIKTVIRYEYKCNSCSHEYVEQRGSGENAYFTKCNITGCSGDYELVTQTESTYEQEVPDPVVEETPAE
jgi:ribosomal protein L37AE/L43A